MQRVDALVYGLGADESTVTVAHMHPGDATEYNKVHSCYSSQIW
jgi:hypothetical protein